VSDTPQPAPSSPLIPLSLVACGQWVRVQDVTADTKSSHRLYDLGIVRGARLRMVQDDGQLLLVAVGDTRIGLARSLAQRVRVHIEEEYAA